MTSWSLRFTSPKRCPHRKSVRKYGTLLMFSVPPATATAASPNRSEREAMFTAAIEEQQARSTV